MGYVKSLIDDMQKQPSYLEITMFLISSLKPILR